MLHAGRPGGPVAAAQKWVSYVPLPVGREAGDVRVELLKDRLEIASGGPNQRVSEVSRDGGGIESGDPQEARVDRRYGLSGWQSRADRRAVTWGRQVALRSTSLTLSCRRIGP